MRKWFDMSCDVPNVAGRIFKATEAVAPCSGAYRPDHSDPCGCGSFQYHVSIHHIHVKRCRRAAERFGAFRPTFLGVCLRVLGRLVG